MVFITEKEKKFQQKTDKNLIILKGYLLSILEKTEKYQTPARKKCLRANKYLFQIKLRYSS